MADPRLGSARIQCADRNLINTRFSAILLAVARLRNGCALRSASSKSGGLMGPLFIFGDVAIRIAEVASSCSPFSRTPGIENSKSDPLETARFRCLDQSSDLEPRYSI